MIEGIKITPLTKLEDNRGLVMHLMKNSSPNYKKFGEVYISVVYNNIVKAWKKHTQMTQNLAVPYGKVKFVCFDDRENSLTLGKYSEYIIGRDNYVLLTIPPNIWYGFQGLNESESIIVNCADIEHSNEEVIRKQSNDSYFSYCW